MTRIAYILKMYPRFSETFIVNEILELERRGVDVRIYSLRKPDDGRFHASLARVKANVIYIPQYPQMEPDRVLSAHRFLHDLFPDTYRQTRAFALSRGHVYAQKRFLQAGIIAAHLLRHPVDAIHAHFATSATTVAYYVNNLIGIPYSFTAHAKDIFHSTVQPGSLQRKIRHARFVVTVSDFNRTYLQNLMGDESGDIRRLYNGIDVRRFRPPTNESSRKPNLILSVGRLVEKKGFDVLLAACGYLKQWDINFMCHIIGKGPLENELRAQIHALGLGKQVKLLGPRPQDKVRQAYRKATIFALPCVRARDGNQDGLPTVLLEAMACGLPVISTNMVGIPEIIDQNVNGLIVPPNDAAALANGLALLLQHPAQRAHMGVAARAKVMRCFDVRQNVAMLHAWLAEEADMKTAVSPATMLPSSPIPPLPTLPTPTIEEVMQAI
ncbi:MAG: colanic acid biosynthesis glycosyltransferase WcaL [Chloroflexi bacterium]|nr:MAG: colanic acid biosynthesis glycosyltransferase WcaL [Chloroflexota bacterium]